MAPSSAADYVIHEVNADGYGKCYAARDVSCLLHGMSHCVPCVVWVVRSVQACVRSGSTVDFHWGEFHE